MKQDRSGPHFVEITRTRIIQHPTSHIAYAYVCIWVHMSCGSGSKANSWHVVTFYLFHQKGQTSYGSVCVYLIFLCLWNKCKDADAWIPTTSCSIADISVVMGSVRTGESSKLEDKTRQIQMPGHRMFEINTLHPRNHYILTTAHTYTLKWIRLCVWVSVSRQATAMAIICSPPNPIQCQCPELRAVSHPAQQQIPDPKTIAIAVAVAHCPLIFSPVLYPSDHREGKVIQTHECLLSSSSSSSWGLVFLSIVAIVVGASTFC